MAIASPTDFIWVVRRVLAPGKLLEREARNLGHDVVDGGLEGRPGVAPPVMSFLSSSRVYPTASLAAILAIGNPVALDASRRGARHAAGSFR